MFNYFVIYVCYYQEKIHRYIFDNIYRQNRNDFTRDEIVILNHYQVMFHYNQYFRSILVRFHFLLDNKEIKLNRFSKKLLFKVNTKRYSNQEIMTLEEMIPKVSFKLVVRIFMAMLGFLEYERIHDKIFKKFYT